MDEEKQKRTLEEIYLGRTEPERTEEDEDEGILTNFSNVLNAKLRNNVKKSDEAGVR